jgi:hypothetical protein
VIITVTRARQTEDDLVESLHVEVNRDTHGQASASGDDDQH